MPVRCRWADGSSRVLDNRLSVCVHAVSGWETYLRVWHLEHILIGHVHLKGVNTYDIIEENDSKRIKKIKRYQGGVGGVCISKYASQHGSTKF